MDPADAPIRSPGSEEVLQDDPQRPVVLIGETVRRPVGWWTPWVYDLLNHLSERGFPAPRPLGLDWSGREQLTFVEGDAGRAVLKRFGRPEVLARFARFLRAFHDAVEDYRPPRDADWALPATADAGPTGICHGDFAPWNVVWNADHPVGLIDFDLAQPGPPWHDVAYALAWSIPFRSDEDSKRILGVDEVPDRQTRIEAFADAYGVAVDGLVDQVVARVQRYASDVEHLRRRGLEARWTSDESIRGNHELADWVANNTHLFR